MYMRAFVAVAVMLIVGGLARAAEPPAFDRFEERYAIRLVRERDSANDVRDASRVRIGIDLVPGVSPELGQHVQPTLRAALSEELASAGFTADVEIVRTVWTGVAHRVGDAPQYALQLTLDAPAEADLEAIVRAACRGYDRFVRELIEHPDAVRPRVQEALVRAQSQLEQLREQQSALSARIGALVPHVFLPMETPEASIDWATQVPMEDVWRLVAERSERVKALDVDLAGIEAEQGFLRARIAEREAQGADSAPLTQALADVDLRLVGVRARHAHAKDLAESAAALWTALGRITAIQSSLRPQQARIREAERALEEFVTAAGREGLFAKNPPGRHNPEMPLFWRRTSPAPASRPAPE